MVCQGGTAGAPCGGRQPPVPTAGHTSAALRTAPVPSGPPPSSRSEVSAGGETGVPNQPSSSATPLPSPEAPIIWGDPSAYQVEHPGGDALLSCDAWGHPAPLVRWSKDGVPVAAGGRLHQLQNGSLAIRAVGVSGAWGCQCLLGTFHGKAKRCANAIGTARAPTWGTTGAWQRMMWAQQQRLSSWPCGVSVAPFLYSPFEELQIMSPLSPPCYP